MSILISKYTFEGPFTLIDNIKAASGVYVIHYENSSGNYTLLDVGESENIQKRISTHDRQQCWNRNSNGKVISASVYYCDEVERMKIEKEIRNNYQFPCGKQ